MSCILEQLSASDTQACLSKRAFAHPMHTDSSGQRRGCGSEFLRLVVLEEVDRAKSESVSDLIRADVEADHGGPLVMAIVTDMRGLAGQKYLNLREAVFSFIFGLNFG